MISMLYTLAKTKPGQPVWFIHGTRSGKEHAFGEHVRKIASENQQLQVYIKYSQPTPQDQLGTDYDEKGYVDINLVKRLVPRKICDFYICGPNPFMRSIFNGLLDWGVSEVQIHYEFFVPASTLSERDKVAIPKRIAEATQCCDEMEVNFSKSGIDAHWNPSFESNLDLAEANGLSPDYSCRSGICHTCICKLERGEVDYLMEPLNPPPEGMVLICCSKPKSNLVIAI